eukprot:9489445-Pyramimonas_sp.AAC.1
MQERQADDEVEEAFNVRRHDVVSGGNKFKGTGTYSTEKTEVEKKRSDFNEGFVEGRFEPLTVFARRCNLKFTDEELLIHHIQAVLGFTVVVDPDDGVTKGVEILDHAPGVKRFRRGAGHYASKSEKTTYDTEGE